MTAERLREAAALLRERAEAATPGPWAADVWPVRKRSPQTGRLLTIDPADGTQGTVDLIPTDGVYGVMEGADAVYIALMAPPVALALADWLDQAAIHVSGGSLRAHPMSTRAITVADAILGTPAADATTRDHTHDTDTRGLG